MTIHFRRLLAIGLGFTLISTPAGTASAKQTDIKRAMELAAQHLSAVQEPQGRFIYDFDLKTSTPTGKDNIVRQAGTAYGLAEYFERFPSPRTKRTLERAIRNLQQSSVGYGTGNGKIVSSTQTLDKAYSGATALALLTELFYHRTTGDDRFATIRAQWLRGLLAMRIKGRGFLRSAAGSRESDYFNGESWLALAVYQDMFSDPVSAQALEQLDRYFMGKYAATPKVGFYHWGIMAAAERYGTTRSGALLGFIQGQTEVFLDTLRPVMHPKANTCYALEGLLTAHMTLGRRKESGELRKRLWARIRAEVEKNMALQIKPGSTVKPRLDQDRTHPVPDAYIGSFLGRSYAEYTRIDYTQHCLSALTKLYRHQNRKAASLR